MRKVTRLLRGMKSRSIQKRYPQYQIGRGTYGDPDIVSLGEGAVLRIGAYCSIAGGVKIFLVGDHRTDWVTTYPFSVFCKSVRSIPGHPRTKGDVIIGNDVWIGTDATILSGVTVGDGAVVGYGSVVTHDVPPYGIVAGNPARMVRKRFNEPTITRLLRIRWWAWDEKKLERFLPLLLSSNIEAFLKAAEAEETSPP
jgi:chloramphenicol O-acetyltransferase type B